MEHNIQTYRELSIVELEKELRDRREELLGTRLSKKTGQLEQPHKLKELRRTIARVQTVLSTKRKQEAIRAS